MWNYDGHHFYGMHWLWWIVWLIFIIWIFATPYDIPGQRTRQDSPLDILKRRFAEGEITKKEYEEKRHVLESRSGKDNG